MTSVHRHYTLPRGRYDYDSDSALPSRGRESRANMVSLDDQKSWLVAPKAKGLQDERIGRIFGACLIVAGAIVLGAAFFCSVTFDPCFSLLSLISSVAFAAGIYFVSKEYYSDPHVLKKLRKEALDPQRQMSFHDIIKKHSYEKSLLFLTPKELRSKLSAEWCRLCRLSEFFRNDYDLQKLMCDSVISEQEYAQVQSLMYKTRPIWEQFVQGKRILQDRFLVERRRIERARDSAYQDARRSYRHSAPVMTRTVVQGATTLYAAAQDDQTPTGRNRQRIATAANVGTTLVTEPWVARERNRCMERQMEAEAQSRQQAEELRRSHQQEKEAMELEIQTAFTPYEEEFLRMMQAIPARNQDCLSYDRLKHSSV